MEYVRSQDGASSKANRHSYLPTDTDTDAWASDKDTPAPSVYRVQFAQQVTSDTDPEDLYNELVNEHGEFVNETTVSLEQVL